MSRSKVQILYKNVNGDIVRYEPKDVAPREPAKELTFEGVEIEPMTFEEYQEKAGVTAVYPEPVEGVYPILALGGEVGEIQNKLKKVLRGDEGADERFRESLKGELGDVLWYLAATARDYGYSLDDIAKANIEKLYKRKAEGTIKGDGDNR